MRKWFGQALIVLAVGFVYWQLVSLTAGTSEPWDGPKYWTLAYPGSLILSGIAGFFLRHRGWVAGIMLTFAQLPVIWINNEAGPLWAVGLLFLCVLAVPAVAISTVHEACAASASLTDDAAACLFVAGLAARFARRAEGATVLWAHGASDLFAPGLAQAGLPPVLVMHVETRSDEEVLAVAEDGLRHRGLAAVVAEVRRTSMTATRRLQLAAEESGTPALLMRRWRKVGRSPLDEPSAALTRWRVGCLPSSPLPCPGVGRARWRLDLVRQRGGPEHSWIVEAPDAEGRIALPAVSSDRQAAATRHIDRAAA